MINPSFYEHFGVQMHDSKQPYLSQKTLLFELTAFRRQRSWPCFRLKLGSDLVYPQFGRRKDCFTALRFFDKLSLIHATLRFR